MDSKTILFLDKIENNAIIIYTSKECTMADNIIPDMIDYINENFYMRDISFDDTYCDILFNQIYMAYVKENKENQFRIKMMQFLKKCLLILERNVNYDYHLFLNNIAFFDISDEQKMQILNTMYNLDVKKCC